MLGNVIDKNPKNKETQGSLALPGNVPESTRNSQSKDGNHNKLANDPNQNNYIKANTLSLKKPGPTLKFDSQEKEKAQANAAFMPLQGDDKNLLGDPNLNSKEDPKQKSIVTSKSMIGQNAGPIFTNDREAKGKFQGNQLMPFMGAYMNLKVTLEEDAILETQEDEEKKLISNSNSPEHQIHQHEHETSEDENEEESRNSDYADQQGYYANTNDEDSKLNDTDDEHDKDSNINLDDDDSYEKGKEKEREKEKIFEENEDGKVPLFKLKTFKNPIPEQKEKEENKPAQLEINQVDIKLNPKKKIWKPWKKWALPRRNKRQKVEEEKNIENIHQISSKKKTIQEAVNKRKMVRFAAFFFYLGLIGLTIGLCFTFLFYRDTIEYPSLSGFYFEMENCTLQVLDHADKDILSPIYVKYRVPRSLDVNPGSTVTRVFRVKNIFESRYCLIELFVKPKTKLDSLTVNCTRCNVTQDNTFQLEIENDLTIKGQIINANLRNIKVKSLNHQVTSGLLQLNNIEASSDKSTIFVGNEGDIVIQSTQEFKVSLTTPTQTFCFKAPSVNQNTQECAVSGDSSTYNFKNSTKCKITADFCRLPGCSPTTKYSIFSNISNVYANLIQNVGVPNANQEGQLLKGYIYESGLGLSPKANEQVSNFNSLVVDQTKSNPFIMLNLGDFGSKSSTYTKWAISSAPSYSYMKPWWISTMSLTILDGYIEKADGFLFPGICPYIPEYTIEHLLDIQTLLQNKINSLDALITFINDETMPSPPLSPQISTGIFTYGEPGNAYDKWYSFSHLPNGNIILQNNDHTKKDEILAAIILSLIIAAYVALLVMELVIVGINLMYEKLVNFVNHLDKYSKLEKNETEKEENNTGAAKPKKVITKKYTLSNILRNAPSPSAFVDYLSLILYRQFSNSVAQFYQLLFKEVDLSNANDQELDPSKDMLKGTQAKIFYEKFCFMNHLNEQKLTDKPNLKFLIEYGFEIITREDLFTEVLTKVNVKNYDNFLARSLEEGENLDSLELYLKQNVEITDFQEDQVDVETFVKIYHSFCDYNRLPRVVISPSVMKEKFDINITMVPQQFIMRKAVQVQEEGEDGDLQPTIKDWGDRYKHWRKRLTQKKKKIYNIDTSKLENHFNLVMGKLTELNEQSIETATRDLICYPKWWLWDGITVLLHILVGAVITIPLIGLIIINEAEYEPWSLKDPLKLITYTDFIRDPATLMSNLYSGFTWNVILIILVTVLWVLTFFDILLYYAVMEFPQDKSFKKSEDHGETFWHKVSRQFEWLIVLLTLSFYFGYIGLVLTWLLLGALINPNAFLPFASAAVTFVTFVITKYKAFKSLGDQGTKAVMDYLKKFFDGFVNTLLGKLTLSMEQAAGSIAEKSKSFLESESFKDVTGKLSETGLIDEKTIAEYTDKIKTLDGKTILAGVSTAVADPAALLREAENLVNSLKQKTIEKVQEECTKRGIPPSLANVVIAIIRKDNKQTKENLMKLIKETGEQLEFFPESVEIVVELLFPQGLNKEELITFLSTKIVKVIFKVLKLNNLGGFTPEFLIQAFNNLKNLQDRRLDTFVEELKNLLIALNNQVYKIDHLALFLPALDLVLAISYSVHSRGNKFLKLKGSVLKLLSSAITHISDPNSNHQEKMLMKDSIMFLNLMSTRYDVPYNFETNQRLESQEIHRIMINFISSLKQTLNAEMREDHFSTLIYLYFTSSRQEMIQELPIKCVKDLQEMLNLKNIATTDFLPFSFSLANALSSLPDEYHNQIKQCASNFGLDRELTTFMRIITCYPLADDQAYLVMKKNHYFIKMAEIIKVTPEELLGILDFVYNKKDSQYVDYFLLSILKRMGISADKLHTLKSIIKIFLSEDELELLQAVKSLHLSESDFLLVGKGVLNPKYVSQTRFEEFMTEKTGENVGGASIQELIKAKDTIFNASHEEYEAWKEEVRSHIPKVQNDQKVPAQEKMARYNLIRLYLTDWRTYPFSKKNITSLILDFNNEHNDLEKKIINKAVGSSYNCVDFLLNVLVLEDLRIPNGERYPQIAKERENSISKLAECLSIDMMTLKNCFTMFVVSDVTIVLKSFMTFFPTVKESHEVLHKVLTYCLKQVEAVQNQHEFITNKIPKNIELPQYMDNSFILPKNLFSLLFYKDPKKSMNIGDLIDLGGIMLKKLESSHPTYYKGLYDFGLFAKGLFTKEDFANLTDIHDERIQKLFLILTEPNEEGRLSAITELIAQDFQQIKIFMAFYGLFTKKNFMVRLPQINDNKYEEETIKQYLSNLFNIYPDVFDVFELVFERNITNFIQKALPLIRRLSKSTVVDANCFESLFSLSFGERFNTGYLSNQLKISPDIIDFFISLTRLAMNKQTRKKEVLNIGDSIPVQKTLSKLKVKPKELIAFVKLIFDMVDNEATTTEVLNDIGLVQKNKEAKKKEIIDVKLFYGLAALNASIDRGVDIIKNKEKLANDKVATENFFNSIGLSTDDDFAFIISKLTAGNYLILEEYKQQLDWTFPNNDLNAQVEVRKLTMGLCGLLNRNINVVNNTDEEIQTFKKDYCEKDLYSLFTKADYLQKRKKKILPSNSLAYASLLIYHSIHIPPCWVQLFFLDRKILKKIKKECPDIKLEFLFSLASSFVSIPDIARDYIGLIEWNESCRKLYEQHGHDKSEIQEWILEEDLISNLDILFANHFTFDPQKTWDFAKEVGVFQEFKIQDENPKDFNAKINYTLFILLINGKSKEESSQLYENLKEDITEPSGEFLLKLAKYMHKNENLHKSDKVLVGEMIRKAFIECYNKISCEFGETQENYKGFELTNLSILSTIMFLRIKPKLPYNRMLYNLHQLIMNIERKVYLDEKFYKLQKFTLMKLAGVSLGVQINNIVEWCLPPSLFTREYAMKIHKAKTQEVRDGIKDDLCKRATRDCQDDMDERQKTNIVGDLGDCAGTLDQYLEISKFLPKIETWQFIEEILGLAFGHYLGDPQGDNPDVLNKGKKGIFGKLKNDKEIDNFWFLSRELSTFIFGSHELKKVHANLNMIDIKTGLKVSKQMDKTKKFEEILTNPNMNLIQGILRGDPSVVLEGDHVIAKRDQHNNKKKLYAALLGLQSFKKVETNDRKVFKDYINMISPYLESEVSRLEEILIFLITKKPLLNGCKNALDLHDKIFDLLLMCIKEMYSRNKDLREMDEEDDVEQQLKGDFKEFSINDVITKSSLLPGNQLNAFEIIRKIYQMNLEKCQSALEEILKVLSKKEKKDGKSMGTKLLFDLIKMIDFDKIKKDPNSGSKAGLFDFLKVRSRNKGDIFGALFDQIMRSLNENLDEPQLKDKDEKLISLQEAEEFIRHIINRDLSQLLEMLVLTNEENSTSAPTPTPDPAEGNNQNVTKQPLCIVKKRPPFKVMLSIFGIDCGYFEKEIRLLKVFLSTASGSLPSLKDKKCCESLVDDILKDMRESKLLEFVDKSEVKDKFAELVLGVSAGDVELIIKAFMTEETLKEAFLLYQILGCLNLNKIASQDRKSYVERHMNVILSAISKKFALKTNLSQGDKTPNSSIEFEGRNAKHLADLKARVREILEGTKPEANDDLRKVFTVKKETEFANMVDVMKRVCDGTILESILEKYAADARIEQEKDEEKEQEQEQMEEDNKPLQKKTDKPKEIIKFTIPMVSYLKRFAALKGDKDAMTKASGLVREICHYLGNKISSNNEFTTNVAVKLIKYIPFVVDILLPEQGGTMDMNKIRDNILILIKNIVSESKTEKANLLYNLLSLIVGTDLKKFDHSLNNKRKVAFNLGPSEKMTLFFHEILPDIFPEMTKYLDREKIKNVYNLIKKLRTDFLNHFKDPHRLKEIVKDIAKLLSSLKCFDEKLADALICLIEMNFQGASYLIEKIVKDKMHPSENIIKFLDGIKTVLNFDFAGKLSQIYERKETNQKNKKIDQESWANILKKIKEGTASSRDLFKVIDEAGDHSGTISEKEFSLLANRLGIKLSPHRIKEIFAKIKGDKNQTDETELNEKEFEQALEYLQAKNLQQALQILGITPEILTIILIKLVILLILIFVFIFLGIKAFAVGGTFGAIINSIFPAAGGIALGKEKDQEKDKLDEKNIENVAETGFEITASEQI